MFKEVAEKSLLEVIDKCTIQMYEKFSKISSTHNICRYEGDLAGDNKKQHIKPDNDLQLPIADKSD